MSMAVKYGMQKKAKKMYDGGDVQPTSTATVDPDKAKLAADSMRKAFGKAEGGCVGESCGGCSAAQCMAEGGLVNRIMKSRKGDEPVADSEEAEFDVLEKDPPPEASYPGSNEIGNDDVDENDADLIRRIMRSRAQKDSLPRPA